MERQPPPPSPLSQILSILFDPNSLFQQPGSQERGTGEVWHLGGDSWKSGWGGKGVELPGETHLGSAPVPLHESILKTALSLV